MSYIYNSLGLEPSEMASYRMLRPSLYGGVSYAPKAKKAKPVQKFGLEALSSHDLRQLCFAKDVAAIAEYERRVWKGQQYL